MAESLEKQAAPSHGALVVDLPARRAFVGGVPVRLTRREFDLLAFFIRNPDRAVSRQELIACVWDNGDALASERTVDIHVRRLRSKLNTRAFRLDTLIRFGYRLTTADGRRGA